MSILHIAVLNDQMSLYIETLAHYRQSTPWFIFDTLNTIQHYKTLTNN